MIPSESDSSVSQEPASNRAEPRRTRTPLLPSAYCLLLSLIIAAILIPIWWFHFFPSTDGGAHLANADVLLHYFRADGATYRAFYQLNLRPLPNTAGHLALMLLLILFPTTVAEKVLVTLIIILFPLSLRYAARGIHRGSGYLAWLAFPLGLNFMLHGGFYNFCLGVCASLVMLGYWIRHREHLKLSHAVVLGGLSLVVYACHLFTIAVGCVAIGVLAAWFTAVDAWVVWKRGTSPLWPALWPGIRSRCVITLAALTPVILLCAKFRFVGRPEASAHHTAWLSLPYWKNLAGLGILFSYRRPELKVGAALAALLFIVIAGLVIVKIFRRHRTPFDGLLLFVGGLTFIYFTKADAASQAVFLPQRLILFIWLGVILWIAAQPVGWWRQRILQTGAALAAIALSVLHFQSYRAMNQQICEYVTTAKQIEPGSTLLPLVFNPCGSPEVCDTRLNRPNIVPFYTAAGYATADRRAIDLRNYEAGRDYFPVVFRASVNPYEKLVRPGDTKALDAIPQRVDIEGYRQRTGVRVDYVLFFAAPKFLDPQMRANPDTLDLQRQLDAGFTLIYTSPGRGAAQLWRRKDWGK